MPFEPIIEGVVRGAGGLMFAGGWRFGCAVFGVAAVIFGLLIWADASMCDSACEAVGKAEQIGDVCMCLKEDGTYVKPK